LLIIQIGFLTDIVYEVLEQLENVMEEKEVIDDPANESNFSFDTKSNMSLSEKLLLFFIIFNISQSAMSYLLKLLTCHNIQVPKSIYLLCKSKEKINCNHFDTY
jgi:hypothetical protein